MVYTPYLAGTVARAGTAVLSLVAFSGNVGGRAGFCEEQPKRQQRSVVYPGEESASVWLRSSTLVHQRDGEEKFFTYTTAVGLTLVSGIKG